MAITNKLRILYNNIGDSSTITASSTQSANTTVANLKKDTKGLVWRSATTTTASSTVKAILLVDAGTTLTISGVVLAFTNLVSDQATIRVKGWSVSPTLSGTVNSPTITGGTEVPGCNTTNVLCCPWNTLGLSALDNAPAGANIYAYGRGTYARVWFPGWAGARYYTIEITDTYPTSASGRYIEVSRLIMGQYWEPIFNTQYGLTSGIRDMSIHERTEAGDLVTKRGPVYSTLNFTLEWIDPTDRVNLVKILLNNGLPKPVLVSLFPDSMTSASDMEKERAHQIYGKMMQLTPLQYKVLEMYGTQFDLEEV